jgi:anaerobic selenocysteine-containing dehydrogenase
VVGLAAAFGSGAMTNSIPELADSGCLFIIGSNTTENHPITAKWIYRAKAQGAKLIVADPRYIQLSQVADIAVQQRLGTDVALINGLMHIILKEGWQDQSYIDERTEPSTPPGWTTSSHWQTWPCLPAMWGCTPAG